MTFSNDEKLTIKTFTRNEVSQCNGKNEQPIWIIFKNSIYDVSNYLSKHPGGKKILLEYAGRDCTRDFIEMGHSNDAVDEMEPLKIGEVNEDKNVKDQVKISSVNSFASITSTDSERKKKRRFLLCR